MMNRKNRLLIVRKVAACIVFASLLLGAFPFVGPYVAGSFPASIDSNWTTTAPTIDGNMTAGEWDNATAVDLFEVPANEIQSYLLAMNDASFLYLCYDAVGDLRPSPFDSASVAFDTNHDEIMTIGEEDQFVISEMFGGTAHIVYGPSGWGIEDSPFNQSLPNHAGLAGQKGFGPSPAEPADHMIFEFSIPLALLGLSPGDSIGFLGASVATPGILDADKFAYTSWPKFIMGPPPLSEYGSMFLDTAPASVDVKVVPSIQSKSTRPSSTIDYDLRILNDGTGGPDTFDINVTSAWTVTILNETGTIALTDTDGDTIIDTGAVPAGGYVDITVRVDVPSVVMGYNIATITFTSSVNTSVSAVSEVHTSTPMTWFEPPHADFGVDTDMPPDGLYNNLVVQANINTTMSEWFDIRAKLYDANGSVLIDTAWDSDWLPIGVGTMDLYFSGTAIHNSGIDGPYLVKMNLFAFNWTYMNSDTHMTGVYNHTEFQPPGALFEPPHTDMGLDTDMPPDGWYNYLIIKMGVNVTKEGWYDVWGTLMDANRTTWIDSGGDMYYLPVGYNMVDVLFEGSYIRSSGIDGPYLADIDLSDDWGNPLDSYTHLTGAYNHTEFQPPGAAFQPPHSDYGVDTSLPPNGFFDILTINVSINVSTADFYRVEAVLLDQSGMQSVAWGLGENWLGPGLTSIDVQFDGREIYSTGIDGPYMADMYLLDSNWNLLDTDTYVTGVYNSSDFEPPGAHFDPPHSDYGVDKDVPPNVQFNYLVIGASINVTTAGFYRIEVTLLDQSSMWWISSGYDEQWLNVGLNSVDVQVSGREIYDSGFDGPYMAQMNLYESNWTWLDSDVYMTSFYNSTDFEPPGAHFDPPHSDYGVDTDVPPNGYYDGLVINVTVNVTVANDYTIEVYLWDQFQSFLIDVTYVYLWLDTGQNYVEAWLSGRDIFDFGMDGPYYVELDLLEYNWSLIDRDTHWTGNYSYTEFEPPGALFDPPHYDYALDVDVPPNGLYDYLVISANVTVILPGDYTVRCIVDHNFSFIGELFFSGYLTAGPQTIDFYFDGYLIRENQTIGPFIVFLYLFDENMIWLDIDFFITDFYQYTDFEPRQAVFSPPHLSYGQDTDSPTNGLFDQLIVEASVMVNKEGDFEIDALLYTAGGNWLAGDTNTTHLTTGLQTVQLMFEGSEIYLAGQDGPYRVNLAVYSSMDQLLDVDSFLTTISYLHTEFDGPDNSPPSSTAFEVLPYLKNQAPIVAYQATDPDPSEGLAYVSLYYSFSLDNTTFGSWTLYQSLVISGNSSTGTFMFGCPEGEGYYRLYTVVGDVAGNVEAPPPQTDTAFQYQIPSAVVFTSVVSSITAGTKGAFEVGVVNVSGVPTPLENSLTLSLVTTSSIGYFVESGGVNQITSVNIEVGEYMATFDYYDEKTGSFVLTVAGVFGTITTQLSVTPASLDNIAISPTTASVEAAQGIQFGASGYDAFGNEITGLTFDWGTSGGIGTITAIGMFTAGTQVASGMVTVSFGGVSESSNVDVVQGLLHHIEISPPNGTLIVDESLQFTAQGYDEYDNPIGGLSFVWTASGDIGAITSAGLLIAGPMATLGQVTVSSSGVIATASIRIRPGPLHHIEILPSSAMMKVDDSLGFTVQGYDEYNNIIADLTYTWEATVNMGSLTYTTGPATDFTAEKDGTCTLTSTSNGIQASISIEIVREGAATPSDWFIYLPLGLIVGLIVGALIGMIVRGMRRPEEAIEPEEEPETVEEEEVEEEEPE